METGSVNLPLWGGLVLGGLLGVVLQRSSFCARAALADAFDGRDQRQLRAFVLAMAVALLGTQLLVGLGRIDVSATPYLRAGVPLLGLLAGGVLFGAGMMLAGGCPSRLIVRAAQGQGAALLTWLVFVLAIMASLEGVLAPVRELLTGPVVQLPAASLPALLGGVPAWTVTAGLLALLAVFLLRTPKDSVRSRWQLSPAGALVGAMVAASWYLSVAGADEFETPAATSLAFVAPAQDFLRYLTMNRLGFGLRFGAATVLGVFIGAMASALLARQFAWGLPITVTQMLRNLAGAVLMALGGILAMGCTIGQGMAGFATLSVSSLIAVAAMVPGAWLAHRLMFRLS